MNKPYDNYENNWADSFIDRHKARESQQVSRRVMMYKQ